MDLEYAKVNLKIAMNHTRKKLRLFNKDELLEHDMIYYCSHWDNFYKVINVCYYENANILKWVNVLSLDDNEVVSHCTAINKEKDFVLVS